MPRHLLLLDTPSLYFRAYYGVPDSVRSPSGEPVNAVRGLIDMVARLVEERRPASLVAAMDWDWRPAFRVALLPSYKAHRVVDPAENAENTPDTLVPQVAVIEDVLEALGIAVIGAHGYEADDVIGTLATRAPGAVEIVTGDRDLFQLVDDARGVRVLYTQKGLGNLAIVDEQWVCDRYGIPGRTYAGLALLRGDPSDGLPGVPGVGEKTAAALMSRFGTVDALMAAVDAGDPRLSKTERARLDAARDYITAAVDVVRVACDVELPEFDPAIRAEPKDPERLVALSERWGLDGPLNRLLGALRAAATQ